MAIKLTFKGGITIDPGGPGEIVIESFEVSTVCVDPTRISDYYDSRKIPLGILERCNSQEHRMIDGVGKGAFLIANTAFDVLNPEDPPNTVSIDLLDILENTTEIVVDFKTLSTEGTFQNHASSKSVRLIDFKMIGGKTITSSSLVVLETAERKYDLACTPAPRNYNVVDPCNTVFTDPVTITYLAPDTTPLTLAEIFEDLLAGTTYSITPHASLTDITSEVANIFLDGLSIQEAIDKLCKAHGLIWAMDETTVQVKRLTEPDPNTFNYATELQHYISSKKPLFCWILYHNIFYPNVSTRSKTRTYYSLQNEDDYFFSTTVDFGSRIHTHYPYLPAFIDSTTTGESYALLNKTALEDLKDSILPNFESIYQYRNHLYHSPLFRSLPLLDCNFVRIIYFDYGDAIHGTVADCRDYPYLLVPTPEPLGCPTAGGAQIEGFLIALTDGTGSFVGRKKATVVVKVASCGFETLIGTPVDVYDNSNDEISGCVFDKTEEELDNVWVWASKKTFENPNYDPNETIPDPENPEGPEIPNPDYDPDQYVTCHFSADDRCCVAADGGGTGSSGSGSNFESF